MSVRAEGHADAGNHFVPARFVLSTPADPSRCLQQARQVAGSWKHAPGLVLSDVLATAFSTLPPPMIASIWGSMLKGVDFCITNVPGPPSTTYLAGSRVESMYAFAPPSGSAVNISLVTPAGRGCVGLTIDPVAVPDGDVLAACLEAGLDEIMNLQPPPENAAKRASNNRTAKEA